MLGTNTPVIATLIYRNQLVRIVLRSLYVDIRYVLNIPLSIIANYHILLVCLNDTC
jgi:hypothetical protein